MSTGVVVLDAAQARHAAASLRIREGDEIVLFDGAGRIAHATVEPHDARATGTASRKRQAGLRCRIERVLSIPAPVRTLTLVAAASKGPRLDWMIEKCTELGVTRIVLADFARSVVKLGPGRIEGLRRTAIESCKQCRRAWLPELIGAVAPVEAIKGCTPGALIVADPDETAPGLAGWLHAHPPAAERLTAVVGPEGGLTDVEIGTLRRAGGQLIRLGEHILRVETAAVAVVANWAARGGGLGTRQ